VWGDSAATTTNLQLRSDSSASEGSITVASGMDLRLINDGATIGDRIRVIAGNIAPAGNDDPRFAVNAANHYTHTVQIIHNADSNIFSSGLYTSSGAGNWASYSISWMRVGNVVTGTGNAVDWGAISTIIAVPVVGSLNILNVNGVWTRSRGSSGDNYKQVTGHIEKHTGGNNLEFFPIGPGVSPTTTDNSDGGIDNLYLPGPTISIRFTFSYVIA